MSIPLLSRKLDLIYLLYFCISIPISFIVDLQPLYPSSYIPTWMTTLTDFYIDTYHDQNFTHPPPHFKLYLWSEALIQVPVMIWSLGALYKGSPKLPLVLLPFSSLIFLTTATCMVEYFFWAVPMEHKINLTALYGPYLFLSGFMFVDMCLRLNSLINRSAMRYDVKKRI